MTVQEYLQSLLQHSGDYRLTASDTEYLSKVGLEAFLYKKLTDKKFRKYAIDPNCEKRVKYALHTKLIQHQPLKIIYFQGGYKLWRFPTSPESDWAEFFNIAYLLQYISPLVAAYPQGVELVYYLHTLLMEKHDNLTTEEITAYVDSFKRLLDAFQKYLPSNLKISILRDADIYPREEYFQRLEEGKEKAKIEFETWSEDKKANYLRMAKLNIKMQGREDWTKLTEEQKQEKYHLAALYEMAATSNLPKVMEIAKAPENILLFTKPTKDFIGIGSTKTSIAKHWVGYGVLEAENGEYFERIVTPSQYELIKNEPHQEVMVGVTSLKNLQTISVYSKRYNFGK